MHRRYVTLGTCLAALLMLTTLGGCALPTVGGASEQTPSATATIPGTPLGWNVYHGAHFTIAYPARWTASNQATSGAQGVVVVLNGPQQRDQIEITETDSVPQDQIASDCSPAAGTPTHLAGLPMSYQTAEGVHRVWAFVSSAHVAYLLSALDADQPATLQAQHDAILATFRPDNTAPGCP